MSLLERLVTPLGRRLRHRRPGDAASIRFAPELACDVELYVTSRSFGAGGTIPDLHSAKGRGENVSPQLSWSAVPDGTRQVLLIMEDVDVPFAVPGIHMSALFSPEITSFAEGSLTADAPGVRFIKSSRGRFGYSGPRPLPGHGEHRYLFHVVALDTVIPAGTALESVHDVLPLVAGHVLGRGALTGVQEG